MEKNLIRILNAHYTKVSMFLDELEHVPEKKLNEPPLKGGWSALQTLHHLILSEAECLSYCKRKVQRGGPYEQPGWKHRYRSFLLWLFLHLPGKYQAPPNIAGDNLPIHTSLQETRLKWEGIQAEWHLFIRNMAPFLTKKAVFKHPRAGVLKWADMIHFWGWHLDWHKAQVVRLLRR